MGVITLTLIATGSQAVGTGPTFWVIAACALAIALGTYTGGWRIIKTMGTGLTDIKPAQGFAAETSTAATILASSHLGFALSTTQVASGSVIGSGLGRKGASVRWRTAGRIGIGWLLTLPAAAAVGAVAALLASTGPVGILIDAILGIAVIVAIFVISSRDQVTSGSVVSEVDDAVGAVRTPKATRKNRKKKRQAAE
jgi:PiT family inorganic phosphate transporter